MAKTLIARNALMLVHSFANVNDEDDPIFRQYANFLDLYGIEAKKNKLQSTPSEIDGINLFFAWVKGQQKYLNIFM